MRLKNLYKYLQIKISYKKKIERLIKLRKELQLTINLEKCSTAKALLSSYMTSLQLSLDNTLNEIFLETSININGFIAGLDNDSAIGLLNDIETFLGSKIKNLNEVNKLTLLSLKKKLSFRKSRKNVDWLFMLNKIELDSVDNND